MKSAIHKLLTAKAFQHGSTLIQCSEILPSGLRGGTESPNLSTFVIVDVNKIASYTRSEKSLRHASRYASIKRKEITVSSIKLNLYCYNL